MTRQLEKIMAINNRAAIYHQEHPNERYESPNRTTLILKGVPGLKYTGHLEEIWKEENGKFYVKLGSVNTEDVSNNAILVAIEDILLVIHCF